MPISNLDRDIEQYIVGVDFGSGTDHTEYIVKSECKQDQGKPRLDLVPPILVEAVGEIMTYGIDKYKEESWRTVDPKRYRAALMRHLMKYLKNPKSRDEESGYYHLWHAACNIAFLLVLEGLEE